MPLAAPARWHGLDAVRGFALVAGVILHASMAFLPGPQLWLVADATRSTTLSVAFFTIHMARMTLFFVLAGFFGRVVRERLGTAGFLRQRALRIGVPLVLAWPLVLGVIEAVLKVVMPGSSAIDGRLTVATFPLAHLWFLYLLLWLYTGALLLRGVVVLLDRAGRVRTLSDAAMRLLIGPWTPLVLAVPVAWWLYDTPYWMMWFGIPTPDTGLLPNRAALLSYGLAFGLGWVMHRQAELLLRRMERWWALSLAMAIAATAACLAMGGLTPRLMPAAFGAPKLYFAALYALGVWSWTCGLIGLGLRFMGAPSATRRYLADASYWIYLAHLPLLLGLQLLMRDWLLPWPVKFVLLLGVTMLLLLLSYHWLVRSTVVGALLNGRRHPRAWPTPSNTGTTLMRAIALLILLPAALGAQAPAPPAAMPLPALLARYATASGPLDKIQNRRVAMKVTGILPEAIPVVSEAMRPNLLRKDATVAGAVQVTATDGTKPWRIDPFASRDGKAVDVPAAELADFLEETDFDGPLIGAAAKGIVLEYAGPKVVQVRGIATPVHAVSVRWPSGRTATVHLDARSYLEVLRTQRRPVMGRDASMSITSSDYRVVQGVQVPYLMEIAVEGAPAPVRLQIDKVEFNVIIDRGRFRRP